MRAAFRAFLTHWLVAVQQVHREVSIDPLAAVPGSKERRKAWAIAAKDTALVQFHLFSLVMKCVDCSEEVSLSPSRASNVVENLINTCLYALTGRGVLE